MGQGNQLGMGRATANAWSEDDVRTLLNMAGKATAGEIAQAVGRSVGAVQFKAVTLRVSLATKNIPMRVTPDQVRTMRRLAATQTVAQVAEALNLSTSAVKYNARIHGIKFAKRGAQSPAAQHPTETLERILALRETGASYASIASEVGMSAPHVWRICNYDSRWRETMMLGND